METEKEAAEGITADLFVEKDVKRGVTETEAGSPQMTLQATGVADHVEDLGKVTVFNVGKHTTRSQLEKLLEENGIEFKRAKKPPHISHAVLSFDVLHEALGDVLEDQILPYFKNPCLAQCLDRTHSCHAASCMHCLPPDTKEQRTAGMEKLRKLRGPKGGELMKPVLTNPSQKRKGSHGDDWRNGRGGKRQRQDGKDDKLKTVVQATASLYGVKSYDEQLAFKEQTLVDEVFLRLPMMVRKDWEKRESDWRRKPANHTAPGQAPSKTPPALRCPSWCRGFKRGSGVVPFDVQPIVPSPEQEGYRNKCEFTLGIGEDGEPTTGFRHGRYEPGVPIKVESPTGCPQVHQDMKALCLQMDAFMRSSRFRPYDDKSRTGVWRLMLARRSVVDNETMAKVVVNLTGLEGTDDWKQEEERMIQELSRGAKGETGTNLVSLWVQHYDGVSAPDEKTPLRLVWGQERLEEALLGLRFSVSPNSFFQVNTKGAEALYKVVIENLELGEDVMLMDVCCGAGTIGICAAAAGGAKKVFGADLCLPAIEDARRNAAANGIDNCEFVCGKAEDVVGKQLIEARRLHLERAKGAKDDSQGGGGGGVASDETKEKDAKKVSPSEPKFAAVIDPPRSGVHAKCLRALRATRAIKRLVYVSCNPTKSLPDDALLLCSAVSNSTSGLPFRPVKAIPVDMFPHTPHIELVMVFERIEYEKRLDPRGPAASSTQAPSASADDGSTGVSGDVPKAEDTARLGDDLLDGDDISYKGIHADSESNQTSGENREISKPSENK